MLLGQRIRLPSCVINPKQSSNRFILTSPISFKELIHKHFAEEINPINSENKLILMFGKCKYYVNAYDLRLVGFIQDETWKIP